MKAIVIYRAASKGKVFTRNERISIINARKEALERKAQRLEILLKERAKASEEKAKREAMFRQLRAMEENPTAKLRKGKGGFFLQGRNDRGGFLPAIAI
jgi:DNA topoisomerase VI subunit B